MNEIEENSVALFHWDDSEKAKLKSLCFGFVRRHLGDHNIQIDDIAQIVYKHCFPSSLLIACFSGLTSTVEMLLIQSKAKKSKNMKHDSIDLNAADLIGFTPLFVAAQNGHEEIVKLLLRNRVSFTFLLYFYTL